MAEVQPQQTFFKKNIEPQGVADITISGGQTIPFVFSLGVNSTVPFVIIDGAGGVQKEFSWGEPITLPPGVSCKVRNSSFHRGDIEIKSGFHENNKPQRVCVPMGLVEVINADGLKGYNLDGYVDTRRAIRAWWTHKPFIAFAEDFDPGEIIEVVILGYYSQHTPNPETVGPLFPTEERPSWANGIEFPLDTRLDMVPLGRNNVGIPSIDGAYPMTLADRSQLVYIIREDVLPPNSGLVVLEY